VLAQQIGEGFAGNLLKTHRPVPRQQIERLQSSNWTRSPTMDLPAHAAVTPVALARFADCLGLAAPVLGQRTADIVALLEPPFSFGRT
jgi:hypothetical protein